MTIVPPIELSRDQLPAPVVSVDEVKREIESLRAEVARQRRERDTLLRDSPRQVAHAYLQDAAEAIRKADLNSGIAWLTLGSAGLLFGMIAGVVLAEATNSPGVGLSTFCGLAAAGLGVPPAAKGIVALADRVRATPPRRMVELHEIERPLERFRRASEVAKAHIANELATTRATLETRQLLSPEARAALIEVAAQAARLEGPAVARQRPLTQLVRLLDEPIDTQLVEGARTALQQVPIGERAQVARAVAELVFADRKRVARAQYAARNSLHELLESHSRDAANTA